MRCTVGELQDRISYEEFYQWLAFMSVEPIGDRRLDLHFAMLSTLIANVNRDPKQRSKPFELNDFMIDFWEDKPKLSLKDKFLLMSEIINAQIAQKDMINGAT